MRFPEFTGEWEKDILQNVVSFSNGKAHENCVDEKGEYILINSKFISTNGSVLKRVTSQLSPLLKSQFVMVMSDLPNGKALAKCYYIEEDNKYTLNQRICSFTAIKGNISRFLMYQINRNKYYLRFDDGINQTNLKKNEVLFCPVNIPTKDEQVKIATLLHLIDERIATQSRIIDKLQSLMGGIRHNIFSQIKDWEKLSIVVQRGDITLNRGNVIPKFEFSEEFCYPVYSSSVQNNGLMGYYNSYMFDKPLISWSIDGGGNFFYRPKHKFNITNVCGIMQVNENIFDYQFLAESLVHQHQKMEFNYQTKAHPSVIVGLYYIPKIHLGRQQQYTKLFNSLSTKIIMEKQELEMLKEQKQYLLSQMFI